jgi:nitrogenase subunit NifH
MRAFQDASLRETLAGRIVLTVGCDTKSDEDLIKAGVALNKEALDTLHLAKIDLADEVLVLNVGGYIGESTRREIAYALLEGVPVRYLEPFE